MRPLGDFQHHLWIDDMAIYVLIYKTEETSEDATYAFGPSEDRCGQLRIIKKTGEITVVSEAPDDVKQSLSLRAIRKLSQHWKAGEFPERTCWAS
jgi:hypothetical protein